MEENNSRDYKQSAIWQKSIELVFAIQKLTGFFPNLENYGSISQIRQYSVSISKYIAEGKKFSNDKKAYFQALTAAQQIAFALDLKIREIKNMPFGKNIDFTQINNILRVLISEINIHINKLKDEIQ